MKLWNKEGLTLDKLVEDFTVGDDRLLDLKLAKFDIQGSRAHAKMLSKVNLISNSELSSILEVLDEVQAQIDSGEFIIETEFEDVHSKIEFELTRKLGDAGKKIHTARSRNDQVLVAICLYIKNEIDAIKTKTGKLFDLLIELAETHKKDLLPGYTHMQLAMPSSFGLWFSAYGEALVDDIYFLNAARMVADQNPLGSAAGYGSSFPVDREETTKELKFSSLKVNSMAAQMSRGKIERCFAFALGNLAATLSKLSMDVCIYMGQNFGFISFPDHLTTGSSIMPHKKNPDVWELIRAKCNRIQALPNELAMIQANLPGGYHRDFQIIKESLFPQVETIKACIDISTYMLEHIVVKKDLLNEDLYDHLFSVETVNDLIIKEGLSFRDAYSKVGKQLQKGSFVAKRDVNHTHIGSVGNLALELITKKMDSAQLE